MPDYDVVVIGAGLGGLTAGAALAKQGRKVLVLEQSERIGGCCSTFERDGYHFDLGASVVEVIQPIQRAFSALGSSLAAELELIPCDPVMSTIYRDGSRVNTPLSFDEAEAELAKLSPEDARRWRDFVAYFAEFTEVALETLFNEPANDLADIAYMIRKDKRLVKFLPDMLATYEDVLLRFFKHPQVLRMMAYQSLYFGLPPELVPGLFALIPYTEHLGVFYPRGGMIAIPRALQRCGERFGMETRLNARVQRVLVRNRRVAGVRLSDGSEIACRLVVSNVNAKMLYLDMIGEEHLPWLARVGVKSYRYSKGVPMIYLGVDYAPPLTAHHSIIAVSPQEVDSYWWNNVKKGTLPAEPFGLICWPTRSDPSLAPKGHHVLNLIPEGFYHLRETTWDAEKPRFVENVIKHLSSYAVPGLADHITVQECATPLDFERRLLLPEGAIYALQQDMTAQAVFRPAARSKSIAGLYLTGSSTHPGGGVPTTITSGIIAARLIEKYEA